MKRRTSEGKKESPSVSVCNQWKMWAHEIDGIDGRKEYHHCGAKWWVELHGLSSPVVPVVMTEDEKGTWLGWIETGTTDPTMVWHERVFEICFPYGSKIEVESGKGRVVRLSIRKDE